MDELSILYHEKKDLKESILCIEEKLRRLKLLYKKNPENYISVLGRLAFLYNEAKDNASAISYTVQRLELIQKVVFIQINVISVLLVTVRLVGILINF